MLGCLAVTAWPSKCKLQPQCLLLPRNTTRTNQNSGKWRRLEASARGGQWRGGCRELHPFHCARLKEIVGANHTWSFWAFERIWERQCRLGGLHWKMAFSGDPSKAKQRKKDKKGTKFWQQNRPSWRSSGRKKGITQRKVLRGGQHDFWDLSTQRSRRSRPFLFLIMVLWCKIV